MKTRSSCFIVVMIAALLIISPIAAFGDVTDDLMEACFSKKTTSSDIQALIDNGANVNARSKNGWTVLMHACTYNTDPYVIEKLVNAGADVNAVLENGASVLMLAARYSANPNIIRVLVNAGADINAKDNEGLAAKNYALRNGKCGLDVIKAIGGQDSDLATYSLFHMNENTTLDQVKYLLQRGADVNARASLR